MTVRRDQRAPLSSELVLHIGTHKTGTTTLQVALRANRRRLASEGIVYPQLDGQGDQAGHHALATHWMDLPAHVRGGPPAETQWRALVEAHASGDQRLVLSSESFSRAYPQRVDFAELARLSDGFGRRSVVCYLRNQAAYLQSAYGQVLQRRGAADFDLFLELGLAEDRAGGLFLDYGELFRQIRLGFKPEEIRFFSYEAACRHSGGIVGHFLELIGATRIGSPRSVNVSPGAVVLWVAAQVAAPRPPTHVHFHAAAQALRALVGSEARPTLMTRRQLDRLRDRFEPLNRQAEQLAAQGSPGFRLAPLALPEPVVFRDDFDLDRLPAVVRDQLERHPLRSRVRAESVRAFARLKERLPGLATRARPT